MPFYYSIRRMPKAMRARTLAGLTRLRHQLDAEMPRRTRTKTLVLGSWNIRNFDDNRFKAGYRTAEDMFYIAEIISRFDVVAVQEICDDLGPLRKVMSLLGPDYRYVVTDITEGRGGNGERLGYIYDRSKARFTGVAGELVLPDDLQIIDGTRKRQFSRTPFMCSFQSGWFKFLFSTVHIYFGADSGAKYERRVNEIKSVAKFLKSRAKRDAKKRGAAQNHILVGDFNIKKPGSPGFNALEEQGFAVFENKKGSNKDQTKYYDQISFLVNPGELTFGDSGREKGVLQFFDSVYRAEDFETYRAELDKTMAAKVRAAKSAVKRSETRLAKATTAARTEKAQEKLTKDRATLAETEALWADDVQMRDYYEAEWRTFRVSDHLPLWVEVEIDFSENYLTTLS